MIQSSRSTIQRELLDSQRWHSQNQLASATFECIAAWYGPARQNRLSDLGRIA